MSASCAFCTQLIRWQCIRLTIKSIFEMHIDPRRTISKLYAQRWTCQTSCTFSQQNFSQPFLQSYVQIEYVENECEIKQKRENAIEMEINLIERKHQERTLMALVQYHSCIFILNFIDLLNHLSILHEIISFFLSLSQNSNKFMAGV